MPSICARVSGFSAEPRGNSQRFRRVAQTSPALLVRGRIERYDGVVNLNAEHLARLPVPVRTASRDFR